MPHRWLISMAACAVRVLAMRRPADAVVISAA
jgi:hypothetical protein